MSLRCKLGWHDKKFREENEDGVKVECGRCGKLFGFLEPPITDEEWKKVVG